MTAELAGTVIGLAFAGLVGFLVGVVVGMWRR